MDRRQFGKMAAGVLMPAVAGAPSLARAERATLSYASEAALKAAPQKPWDLIKVFDKIDAWHPATKNCRMVIGENTRPGAVREFDVEGGAHVMSELLEYDEAKMYYKYRIIKTDLPLANYVATMQVVAGADGGSIVKWAGTFQRPDAAGAEDAATQKLVEMVFAAGLGNLVKLTSK